MNDAFVSSIAGSLVGALAGGFSTFRVALWQTKSTITADNERQRQEEKTKNEIEVQKKNRLISSILVEVYRINQFYREHNQVEYAQNYVLEASAIESTVQQQIRYFKNHELLKAMSELRETTKWAKQGLHAMSTMLPNNMTYSSAPQIFKSNWNPTLFSKKQALTKVRELLLAEYTGPMIAEFERWQEN